MNHNPGNWSDVHDVALKALDSYIEYSRVQAVADLFEALADAGYTLVQLPKPDRVHPEDGLAKWAMDPAVQVYAEQFAGNPYVTVSGVSQKAGEARAHALRLLAAANHAEQLANAYTAAIQDLEADRG